jgi:hypothetical protein
VQLVNQLKLRLGEPELESRDKSLFSIKIIVENLSDVALRDCQVFLQKLEFYDEESREFRSVSHSKYALPLAWANLAFLEKIKCLPQLLGPGDRAVEFLEAQLNDRLHQTSGPAFFYLSPKERHHLRERQFWERGKYRFTIVASSTDCLASEPLVVEVRWSGLPKDMAVTVLSPEADAGGCSVTRAS